MPTYEYECPSCKASFEERRSVESRGDAKCPCGETPRIVIVSSRQSHLFEPYYCVSMGAWVRSHEERRRLMREQGLTEVGGIRWEDVKNEVDRIHREHWDEKWRKVPEKFIEAWKKAKAMYPDPPD